MPSSSAAIAAQCGASPVMKVSIPSAATRSISLPAAPVMMPIARPFFEPDAKVFTGLATNFSKRLINSLSATSADALRAFLQSAAGEIHRRRNFRYLAGILQLQAVERILVILNFAKPQIGIAITNDLVQSGHIIHFAEARKF